MDENENLRLKKLVRWLIGQGTVSSQEELAKVIGYTKSSFSLIVNEKVNLSSKFINRICAMDSRINREWVRTGIGEMILDDVQARMERGFFDLTVEESKKELENTIQVLLNSLSEKEKELEGQKLLVRVLTDKLQDLNRQLAQLEQMVKNMSKDGGKNESVQSAARIA